MAFESGEAHVDESDEESEVELGEKLEEELEEEPDEGLVGYPGGNNCDDLAG